MSLNRIRLVVVLAGVAAFVAVWGLMLNIKTADLNTSIQKLAREISKVEQENRELELEVLERMSLEKIESVASEDYRMAYPRKVRYLRIN